MNAAMDAAMDAACNTKLAVRCTNGQDVWHERVIMPVPTTTTNY